MNKNKTKKKERNKKKPTSFEQDFRALKQQPDGGVCRKPNQFKVK